MRELKVTDRERGVRQAILAVCGITLLAVCSDRAGADEVAAKITYPKDAVMCLAGCRGEAPAIVAEAPNILALSETTPQTDELVITGVWCGKNGGCTARDHVVPPRFYNGGAQHSIAVFQRW